MRRLLAWCCFHPFTTRTGHVETCSWCGAWRSSYTRVIPGRGYDGTPGAWRHRYEEKGRL